LRPKKRESAFGSLKTIQQSAVSIPMPMEKNLIHPHQIPQKAIAGSKEISTGTAIRFIICRVKGPTSRPIQRNGFVQNKKQKTQGLEAPEADKEVNYASDSFTA